MQRAQVCTLLSKLGKGAPPGRRSPLPGLTAQQAEPGLDIDLPHPGGCPCAMNNRMSLSQLLCANGREERLGQQQRSKKACTERLRSQLGPLLVAVFV